jgi:hypothetical protein
MRQLMQPTLNHCIRVLSPCCQGHTVLPASANGGAFVTQQQQQQQQPSQAQHMLLLLLWL